MGRGVGLADLAEVQPEVHRSLVELLGFSGDVTDLGLVFQARPLLNTKGRSQADEPHLPVETLLQACACLRFKGFPQGVPGPASRKSGEACKSGSLFDSRRASLPLVCPALIGACLHACQLCTVLQATAHSGECSTINIAADW